MADLPKSFGYRASYHIVVLTPSQEMVWALPLSLAATDGIDIIFLFLQVLRCFNSLGLPSLELWIHSKMT